MALHDLGLLYEPHCSLLPWPHRLLRFSLLSLRGHGRMRSYISLNISRGWGYNGTCVCRAWAETQCYKKLPHRGFFLSPFIPVLGYPHPALPSRDHRKKITPNSETWENYTCIATGLFCTFYLCVAVF